MLQKLKFALAKIFRVIMQLAKVAELVNFLGFMTQNERGKWRRNISETIL